MRLETVSGILIKANRLFLCIYLAAFALFVGLALLALLAFVLIGR